MDIKALSSFAAQQASFKGGEKAVQTAQDFESFFMFQVLELMSPKMEEDSMFTGGFAEEIFRHQMNEQAANEIVERGGIGIADQLYGQLLKYQEKGEIF